MVFTLAQMAKRKLPGLPSRLTETKDLVRRESAEMKAQHESQSQVVALEREVSMLKQQLADAKTDWQIGFPIF